MKTNETASKCVLLIGEKAKEDGENIVTYGLQVLCILIHTFLNMVDKTVNREATELCVGTLETCIRDTMEGHYEKTQNESN